MIDDAALEAAAEAACIAVYPRAVWNTMPPDSRKVWREMAKAAIEEYQRATLKGYAEKIERKGF